MTIKQERVYSEAEIEAMGPNRIAKEFTRVERKYRSAMRHLISLAAEGLDHEKCDCRTCVLSRESMARDLEELAEEVS